MVVGDLDLLLAQKTSRSVLRRVLFCDLLVPLVLRDCILITRVILPPRVLDLFQLSILMRRPAGVVLECDATVRVNAAVASRESLDGVRLGARLVRIVICVHFSTLRVGHRRLIRAFKEHLL